MSKIEYDKLEWMKDLPKPQAGDSKVMFSESLQLKPEFVYFIDKLILYK